MQSAPRVGDTENQSGNRLSPRITGSPVRKNAADLLLLVLTSALWICLIVQILINFDKFLLKQLTFYHIMPQLVFQADPRDAYKTIDLLNTRRNEMRDETAAVKKSFLQLQGVFTLNAVKR